MTKLDRFMLTVVFAHTVGSIIAGILNIFWR